MSFIRLYPKFSPTVLNLYFTNVFSEQFTFVEDVQFWTMFLMLWESFSA